MANKLVIDCSVPGGQATAAALTATETALFQQLQADAAAAAQQFATQRASDAAALRSYAATGGALTPAQAAALARLLGVL